jgi:hypothetical protein
MSNRRLKMWTGNLDGSRRGLVIATSRKRAAEVVGVGRKDFEGYWHEMDASAIDETLDDDGNGLEADTLYTRPLMHQPGVPIRGWGRGRCPT